MVNHIVGVMGPGRAATEKECAVAYEVGKVIGELGHTLLTGGVGHGVMDAASKGAQEAGGLVIGVLPHKLPSQTHPVSRYVSIPIVTTFGEGRNVINALSSDIIVVVGMCPGTASEVCFAIKAEKPIIMMEQDEATVQFFRDVLHGKIEKAPSIDVARTMIDLHFFR